MKQMNGLYEMVHVDLKNTYKEGLTLALKESRVIYHILPVVSYLFTKYAFHWPTGKTLDKDPNILIK